MPQRTNKILWLLLLLFSCLFLSHCCCCCWCCCNCVYSLKFQELWNKHVSNWLHAKALFQFSSVTKSMVFLVARHWIVQWVLELLLYELFHVHSLLYNVLWIKFSPFRELTYINTNSLHKLFLFFFLASALQATQVD